MNKPVYKFALFIALVTLSLCILSGISITTSILRTAIVFLGTLFIVAVFATLLRWTHSSAISRFRDIKK